MMEAEISCRLGRGPEVSPETHKMINAAMDRATASPAERDDFFAQARDLAESDVDQNWKAFEPLARRGNLVFSDLGHLPANLIGMPLHPLVPPTSAVPERPTRYDCEVMHRVAHAVVGAALTGQPVSVGFSGIALTQGSGGPERYVPAMLAGNVVDKKLMCDVDSVDGCDCLHQVSEVILWVLGITGVGRERPLYEQLEAIGREDDFREYLAKQWTEADRLVRRGFESGFMDVEAERLKETGRITVDPVAAASALGLPAPESD